jgi:hypothetical protein
LQNARFIIVQPKISLFKQALSSGVALVEVRVNVGSWQPASLSLPNWSRSVTLSSGPNLIEARSQDGAGYYSSIGALTVTLASGLPQYAVPGLPDGFITARVYLNCGPSGSVSNLLSDPRFPNSPDTVVFEDCFELWTTGDSSLASGFTTYTNYGAQMLGYFYPPKTGNYTFYICSDDNSELFLSTDDNPANKRLIATETSWSEPRQYVASHGQSDLTAKRSDQYTGTQWPTGHTITLTQGRPYYIEAIMKQGGGGDNLSVSIDGNGPIPGKPWLLSSRSNSSPATSRFPLEARPYSR